MSLIPEEVEEIVAGNTSLIIHHYFKEEENKSEEPIRDIMIEGDIIEEEISLF